MVHTGASHILLADDEVAITDHLAPFLERAGFAVTVAAEGDAALEFVSRCNPDLVILDVLMPCLDGRQVLRHMRQASNWTPVILLAQISSPADRADALSEGADDYLSKPLEPCELLARIRAVLRRTRSSEPPLRSARCLRSGPLTLDRRARYVALSGQRAHLSLKTVSVLEYLMLHPGEVVSRERLLDTVWGWDCPVADRVVDVRVAELRRVLNDCAEAPSFVETLIGHGYRFVGRVEAKVA